MGFCSAASGGARSLSVQDYAFAAFTPPSARAVQAHHLDGQVLEDGLPLFSLVRLVFGAGLF
jgi:hypothetical protein